MSQNVLRVLLLSVYVMLHIVAICAVPVEEFYPYEGPGSRTIRSSYDGSSVSSIPLDPGLNFYGRSYNECYVRNKGIITLKGQLNNFTNDSFPLENDTIIAPFYGDVDTRDSDGMVWYTDTPSNDSTMLQKVKRHINSFTEYKGFSPAYLIVVTWRRVGYYNMQYDKLNTFQSVIATDGDLSFAIFLYNKTEWTTAQNSSPAKVGFNAGYGNKSWEVPCSQTTNVAKMSTTSNIGIPGIWTFRIDKEIVPAVLNEACENDELCSCLTKKHRQNCLCKGDPDSAVTLTGGVTILVGAATIMLIITRCFVR